MLPLRPLDVLEVRPDGVGWAVERGGHPLAVLEAAQMTGAGVLIGERSWTLAGEVIPLRLALIDDADGTTVVRCTARRLRPGALVQVAGAEEDVTVSMRLRGGALLRTDGGEDLATLRSTGTGAGLALRVELADRALLPDYAPGILVVCLWRLLEGLAPTPPAPIAAG